MSNQITGIAQGWDEAAEWTEKLAVKLFLKGDTAGAVALREASKEMRITSNRILSSPTDDEQ